MKTIKYVAAVTVFSLFAFAAVAAQPASTTTTKPTTAVTQPVATSQMNTIEAGTNMGPSSDSTGRSMDDAFNVYTLEAGGW